LLCPSFPAPFPAAEFYPSIARDAAGGSHNIAQLLPAATGSGIAAGSGSYIGWSVQQQQLEGAGSQLQPGTPVQSQSPAAIAAAASGAYAAVLPLQQQQQQQMYPGLGNIPPQVVFNPGMPVQQSAQIPAGWLQPQQPEQQQQQQQQDGQLPLQQQQQLPFGMKLQQQPVQQHGGLLQQRSSGVTQPQDQQQQQQQPPQQQRIPKLLGGLSLDDQICMHLQQQKQQQQSDQTSDQDVTPQQQHPDQQQRASPDHHQQQQQLPRPPHPLNARSFLRRNTTLWAREIMDSRCNVDMAMLEFDPGVCVGDWSAGLAAHCAMRAVRSCLWLAVLDAYCVICWALEIVDSRCNEDMAMLEFDPGGCEGSCYLCVETLLSLGFVWC
jgi:hypothetical protein